MNSNDFLNLRVITPEGIMRELDNLRAINVPLVNDYIIGIRPNHAPLIAETKQGKIICRTKTSETYLELHGGVLEVRENVVTIFTLGEVSAQTFESTEPSKNAYKRLMETLTEKIDLT